MKEETREEEREEKEEKKPNECNCTSIFLQVDDKRVQCNRDESNCDIHSDWS